MTARSVDDLLERRSAVPTPVDETGEWTFDYELEVSDDTGRACRPAGCTTSTATASGCGWTSPGEYQLDGVSLWALGFEDDAVWEQILPTVADPFAPSTTE